jgi:hypothetical protein
MIATSSILNDPNTGDLQDKRLILPQGTTLPTEPYDGQVHFLTDTSGYGAVLTYHGTGWGFIIPWGTTLPDPSIAKQGQFFYKSDTALMYTFDGTTWQSLQYFTGGTTHSYLGSGTAQGKLFQVVDTSWFNFETFAGRTFKWAAVFKNSDKNTAAEFDLYDYLSSTPISGSTITVPASAPNDPSKLILESGDLTVSGLSGNRIIEVRGKITVGKGTCDLMCATMIATK